MQRYILRRLLQAVITVLLLSIVVFGMVRIIPGDPATVMLGHEMATAENRAEVLQQLGLDRPIYVQYVLWLKDVLQGELGTSWRSGHTVAFLLSRRLPASLFLAMGATLLGLLISIPLGILSGMKPHSVLDTVCSMVAVGGVAIPSMWLGLMLIMFFAVRLGWLPTSGYVSPAEDLVASLKHVALPAFTLGIAFAAPLSRYMRSGMLDVMNTDYVRTARSKGLNERLVVSRHVLRNALLSVVTIFGISFGELLGGAIVTETVFFWPGLSTLLVDSIAKRDYALVQGVVLFIGLLYILINLLIDLSYGFLDPRIRYE